MPSVDNQIQLQKIDQELDDISTNLLTKIESVELKKQLNDKINGIKLYYKLAANKADWAFQETALVKQYSNLVSTFKKISTNEITYEAGLGEIKDITKNQKMKVIAKDILQVCKILACAALATICAMALYGVLPYLSLAPAAVGVTFIIPVVLALAAAVKQFFSDLFTFESFSEVNKQDQRATDLLMFFKPAAPIPVINSNTYADEEAEMMQSAGKVAVYA